LTGQGSHQIGTLRSTNGFIKLAEESVGFRAGDGVSVWPLFS
jgi:molybdopterin biosynthesis enzyme